MAISPELLEILCLPRLQGQGRTERRRQRAEVCRLPPRIPGARRHPDHADRPGHDRSLEASHDPVVAAASGGLPRGSYPFAVAGRLCSHDSGLGSP